MLLLLLEAGNERMLLPVEELLFSLAASSAAVSLVPSWAWELLVLLAVLLLVFELAAAGAAPSTMLLDLPVAVPKSLAEQL